MTGAAARGVLHPHGLIDLTSDTRVSPHMSPGVKLSLRNGRLTSLLWISTRPAGDVGAAEFQPCPFVAKSMASKELRLLFGEGREADLSATLRQKKMPNLCHAVLSGINITGAVLSNLNMALADLRAANTAYSDMRGAN
jgi:Pentapeptide repeats (8 copies)